MSLSDATVSRNVRLELLEGHSCEYANSCITGFELIISTENCYHKKENVFAASEPLCVGGGLGNDVCGMCVQLDPSSDSTLEMLVLLGYLMSGHSQPLGLGPACWSTPGRACSWHGGHGCRRATCQGWTSRSLPFLCVEAVALAGRAMRSRPHTRSGLLLTGKAFSGFRTSLP